MRFDTGDVLTYIPEHRATCEGVAIMWLDRNRRAVAHDTFFGVAASVRDRSHILTDAELATATKVGNIAAWDLARPGARVWDYRETDRMVIPSQHGAVRVTFVRHGARPLAPSRLAS